MFQVGARSDVHVQAGDAQPVVVGVDQALGELLVPDAVLGMVTAGVRLAAVAVPKAGIDAERDLAARGAAAVLVDHVGRAAIDVDILLEHQLQRRGVEDVGGIDDGRRIPLGLITGRQRAADLEGTDRIDQGPVAAQQVENGQIRAGLLGVADHVESP